MQRHFTKKSKKSVCSRTRTCLLEPSQILSAMDLFVEKALNYFFQKVYVIDVQLDSKHTPIVLKKYLRILPCNFFEVLKKKLLQKPSEQIKTGKSLYVWYSPLASVCQYSRPDMHRV